MQTTLKFVSVRLGQVRLGYVMLILMLFAPQMNIIFAISTSNNLRLSTKFMHERGGVPQLDIYPFPHGWSFFGKVGGAKSDIGSFFCAKHDENQSYNDVKP